MGSSTQTDIDLLKLLKVPTFSDPATKQVTGFQDFLSAVNYSDNDYNVFVSTLFSSVGDVTPVGSTDQERADYITSINSALRDVLYIIQEKRHSKNRLNSLPSTTAAGSEDLSQEAAVSRAFNRKFSEVHTMIGPIMLDPAIPVVDVEINENYDVKTTRTLRSITDPVVKGHKNNISMAITIEVPQSRINDVYNSEGTIVQYGLRSLLATLKACPIVEIASSAITPVFVNSILAPEIFEKVRDDIVKSAIGEAGLEKRRSKQAQQLQSGNYSEDLDKFKEFIGNLNPVIDFIVSKDKTHRDTMNVDLPVTTESAIKLKDFRKDAITVPCAFQGAIIKTAPEATNTLQVKLFFARYNDKVWQPGQILYRDKNGNLTPNVAECPWILRMAEFMFLREENLNNNFDFMKPYQTVFREQESGITFEWEDPSTGRIQEFKPNGKDFVVEDVAARIFMKMATIPLLGSTYPVCQYMGIDNLQGKVTVNVKNPLELAKFHEMKAALDEINNQSGAPLYRRHYVKIKNNLLNFLGATDFVISGITTSRVADQEIWKLEFEVIESRISFAQSEAITLKNEGSKEEADVKKIWDHIYSLLTEEANIDPYRFTGKERLRLINDQISKSGYKFYPLDPNNPKSFELDYEGQLAHRLVFGENSTGIDSILQPNILAATWYRLTQRGDDPSEDNYITWNTSFENDPLVSAVMEGRQWDQSYGVRFTNDRSDDAFHADTGILIGTSYVTAGDGTRRSQTQEIWGRYNPTSVFTFSSSNPVIEDNRFLENQGFFGNLLPEERYVQEKAANWLSKGNYDHEGRFLNAFDTVFSNTARKNLKQQGAELLAWMAAGTGRVKVFFTKEFWDTYLDIVLNNKVRPDTAQEQAWNNEDINEARDLLISLVRSGFYEEFNTLDTSTFESLDHKASSVRVNIDQTELDNISPSKYNPATSNFGDMNLPTYARFFADQADPNLWRKFSPTYGDLGIKPPYHQLVAFENIEDALSKCARSQNDPIEPDLPYFHYRLKPDALAETTAREEAGQKALQEVNNPKRRTIQVPNEVAREGRQTIDRYLKEIWKPASQRSDPRTFGKQIEHDSLNALSLDPNDKGATRSLVVIDQEGMYLGNVVPHGGGTGKITFNDAKGKKFAINSGDGFATFDPYSQDHILKTNQDLYTRTADRSFSLSRVYPAYRLFFIEEDRGNVYLSDDLYGVNSLINLSLRVDKHDAAVLTCQLSNVTDNLSNEEILTDDSRKKLGLPVDDGRESYFAKLKLQTGVLVQLRLGYGSSHDDLPVVFNGMITEIKQGKIVEITAQGHKRELLNEVQFQMDSINHFDIIRKVLEKTEHPNLGDSIKTRRLSGPMLRSIVPPGQDPRSLVTFSDFVFNKKMVDMTNINLNSNAPLEVDRRKFIDRTESFAKLEDVKILSPLSIFTDESNSWIGRMREYMKASTADPFFYWLTEFLPDSIAVDIGYEGGKNAEWIIPPQTAWEAILEVTRHRPGHIAQVVPFENGGTIFVGQPEQPYLAREPNHQEMRLYSALQPILSKESQVDLHADLIGPFVRGRWAKVYLAHFLGARASQIAIARYPGTSRNILAPNSDESIFLEVDDILDLEDLPDNDDRETVINLLKGEGYWATEGLESAAIGVISEIVGPSMPGQFSIMDDWWVYTNDLTDYWDEIRDVDPFVIEQLFYWYYNIDPSKAALVLGTAASQLRTLMFGVESQAFETFKENVGNPNSIFQTNYRSLLNNGRETLTTTQYLNTSKESEISRLEERNLISSSQAERLRERISTIANDTTIISRNRLTDLVTAVANDLGPDATLAEVLLRTGGGFRLFIYYMYRHINSEQVKGTLNEGKIRETARKMRVFDLPPGYQVFREYHLIGEKDIIANNIFASMAEMSNCTLVRSPSKEVEYDVENSQFEEGEEDIIVQLEETDWTSYPTTDGIPFTHRIGKQNRKLGVVYELNAIHPNQKAMTLLSNMGTMIQPMYRGELIIVGRNIKPHDVVYIQDPENELRGHFEVASVTHHFNTETGWVSVIEPHALVRVNNPTSELQLTSMQGMLRTMSGVLDVLNLGLLALTVAGFVMGGPGVGRLTGLARTGIMKAAGTAGKYLLKASVLKEIQVTAVVFGQSLGQAFPAVTGGSGWLARKSLAFAGFLGKTLVSPIGAVGLSSAWGVANLADAMTSLYVKHQLSSTELPVDVHLLMYRGQKFQAGLEVDNEDIYSIYEKFEGLGKDIKGDLEDFFTEVFDDVSGSSSRGSTIENAISDVNRRRAR